MQTANSFTTILEAKNISKKFGYTQVLKNASLTLEKGQFTLLLGKNGAGKSTLFKIICGLHHASSGAITIQGENSLENPHLLRNSIGLISHSSHHYDRLSAKENLQFYGKLRSIPNLEAEIKNALTKVGLKNFSSLAVQNFSSGMKKKLSIAKLMITKPPILLLDEPYTGLDYDSIEFFNDFLINFKNQGGTILMITHQIETSFKHSDQFVVLHQGKTFLLNNAKEKGYNSFFDEYQKVTQQ
jgi:sodium transport system ATP-binding protein